MHHPYLVCMLFVACHLFTFLMFFIFLYKLGTASSKIKSQKLLLHRMFPQTVVFSGSPEPCVSNLIFSHECYGVLMLVLKIK